MVNVLVRFVLSIVILKFFVKFNRNGMALLRPALITKKAVKKGRPKPSPQTP